MKHGKTYLFARSLFSGLVGLGEKFEFFEGPFSRARSYAARCETLLMQVEQEVALWDSDNPEQAPQPYRPA